eukprot:TRINITY_DN10138_c0_g1_i3.p1 TRINITY_DN10138_c0_g1~~TRINITY_DN10138_c0_g1_i3.p1  ORF type:complete len:476 (+),score=84.37 TRINITY_DN10138_c0_g1_i3:325-1752(+)
MWIRYLGFGEYEKKFLAHSVDLQSLISMKEQDFKDTLGIESTEEVERLLTSLQYYNEYSSAEATFMWLREQGMEQYSYQFARYNIPFYALPLVNFFIIDEMGISGENKVLLEALEDLKKSPCYLVKAMSLWLRDLELEHYALSFAANLMVSFLESLTILNEFTIDKLIFRHAGYKEARGRIKAAVQEMKEVQFYYSASAALLNDAVLEKYYKFFTDRNISIALLPLLTEQNLIDMGLGAPARAELLRSIQRIREEIPSGALEMLNRGPVSSLFANDQCNHGLGPDRRSIFKNGLCGHNSNSHMGFPPQLPFSGYNNPLDPRRNAKRKRIKSKAQPPRVEDTRAVDDLLSFINGKSKKKAQKITAVPSKRPAGKRSRSRNRRKSRAKKKRSGNQKNNGLSSETNPKQQPKPQNDPAILPSKSKQEEELWKFFDEIGCSDEDPLVDKEVEEFRKRLAMSRLNADRAIGSGLQMTQVS